MKKVSQALRRPKSLVFLGFLLLSFLIWLMITLSGKYITTVRMQVAYVNVPQEKLLLGDPDHYVDASVYANGYRLLNNRFFGKELALNVSSFNAGKQGYYLTRTDLENQMKGELEGLEIRRVLKDTLWLSLGSNAAKKVKVVPDLTVTFQEDHEYATPLEVEPDSIWVRGPEDMVSAMDSVITEKIVLRSVKEDFVREVSLFIPDSLKKLKFDEQKVVINAEVSRYSEKMLEVPLSVTNVPEGVSIKTFPSAIRVLCKADIADLKRLVPSGFRVECDFKETRSDQPFLLPHITEKPSFVRSATLLDNKVEYLINRS
ncbi:CdaR family protein [Robertkochia sediminum]|uniref:CdaR family protein n=1 Tax=Robertkochia sediminum TaxID=2785326 RepID=UPI00193226C0|nr:YbbR-like domain-containing protein [Robertkochia sediminum]MBL7473669.1 YbbR-like domain-containing protein [Robertkochia sediminum]